MQENSDNSNLLEIVFQIIHHNSSKQVRNAKGGEVDNLKNNHKKLSPQKTT